MLHHRHRGASLAACQRRVDGVDVCAAYPGMYLKFRQSIVCAACKNKNNSTIL